MKRTDFDTLIICDNFLEEKLLKDLTELVTGAETIALNNEDCNHVMEEATAYDWYMLRTELRRSELRYPFLKKVGEVIGLELPTRLIMVLIFLLCLMTGLFLLKEKAECQCRSKLKFHMKTDQVCCIIYQMI